MRNSVILTKGLVECCMVEKAKQALSSMQNVTGMYHQLVHPAIRTVVHHHYRFLKVLFLFCH